MSKTIQWAALISFLVIANALACGGGGGNGSPGTTTTDPGVTTTTIGPARTEVNTAGLGNYGVVIDKQLTRSAQPTAQGFKNLKAAGVTAVLKLNMESESKSATEAQEFGGEIWNHPINYMAVDCADAQALADELENRILAGDWIHIHCTRGIDRTALIIGIWKIKYQGETYQSIQSDWKIYGDPSGQMKTCLQQVK